MAFATADALNSYWLMRTGGHTLRFKIIIIAPRTIIARDHHHHEMNSSPASMVSIKSSTFFFYLRATEVYHCVNRFLFCITMPCLFARQVNPYKHYNIQKKLRALPWCCWCHSEFAISARSAVSSSFRILNLRHDCCNKVII